MNDAAGSTRIALFLPSLRGGGAERVMVTLGNGFCSRGFKVDLVLAKAEGPYLADVDPEVRIVDLKQDRVSRCLPALVRYLRRERPVSLLSGLNHVNVVAVCAVAISRIGTKLVLSEHNSIRRSFAGGGIKARAMLAAMAITYPRADTVVAVSDGVAADLRDLLPGSARKVQTVYNPIVTKRLLEQAAETASGIPPGPVILAVGRLTRQKDFQTLIKAFSLLDETIVAKLVILGEGELRQELEKLAATLNISERVVMPGFVSNPYAWMRAADLFVLSSAWEGLPTVLIEAMACGTPVVSTDCPSGPAEILEAGKWGRLVPVGDAERLSRAISETLAGQSVDVRQRARDFTAPIAIDRYLDLLMES
jgi:glycosyltransferase involved in cell wall biosynthesis